MFLKGRGVGGGGGGGDYEAGMVFFYIPLCTEMQAPFVLHMYAPTVLTLPSIVEVLSSAKANKK